MTPEPRRLAAPLVDATLRELRAGDDVLLDGVVYGARDAAHARLFALLEAAKPLPVDLRGQVIYYVGPAPARAGQVVGSAGPTTSSRMDPFTPALYAAGLKATIGKGKRSAAVREALVRHGGVYLAAVGGTGALLSRRIVSVETVAWPELGPEALFRFEVRDFPAVVVNDTFGNDLYEQARELWRIE